METIQEGIDREVRETMEKLAQRNKEIDERVAKFKCIHEDIVYIHRYDNIKVLTFLAQAESVTQHRLRTSWYGRVIAISDRDCGDAIRQQKKVDLKKDDVISFNPDAAYSLNVAGFEEIWIVHIDSVLHIDTGFDYMKSMRENAEKLAEIIRARKAQEMSMMNARAKANLIDKHLDARPS